MIIGDGLFFDGLILWDRGKTTLKIIRGFGMYLLALGWLSDRLFATDWGTALAGWLFFLNGWRLYLLETRIDSGQGKLDPSLSDTMVLSLGPKFWTM